MSGIAHDVGHDAPVALAAQSQEVVVLEENLRGRAGEIQTEILHLAAQIIDLEDQFLIDATRIAKDDATHTRIDQPVLVITDIDRADLRQPEIPGDLGVDEGHDEAPGGPVHMNGDVPAPLLADPDQQVVDTREVVVLSGEGGANHDTDRDGILVDQGFDVRRSDHVFSGL